MGPDPNPLQMKNRFATARIGSAGGKVRLQGVSLEFPPGALPDETDSKLGIIYEKSHQLHLKDEQALLTPIVSCEPHGLHLQKPVKLVLPHCALVEGVEDIERAWKFTILKNETELNEGGNWVETASADWSGIEITDRYIHLNLQHFSNWVAIGIAKLTGHSC